MFLFKLKAYHSFQHHCCHSQIPGLMSLWPKFQERLISLQARSWSFLLGNQCGVIKLAHFKCTAVLLWKLSVIEMKYLLLMSCVLLRAQLYLHLYFLEFRSPAISYLNFYKSDKFSWACILDKLQYCILKTIIYSFTTMLVKASE